jgi:hypothetical protein
VLLRWIALMGQRRGTGELGASARWGCAAWPNVAGSRVGLSMCTRELPALHEHVVKTNAIVGIRRSHIVNTTLKRDCT